jgi:hypothetical protein
MKNHQEIENMYKQTEEKSPKGKKPKNKIFIIQKTSSLSDEKIQRESKIGEGQAVIVLSI